MARRLPPRVAGCSTWSLPTRCRSRSTMRHSRPPATSRNRATASSSCPCNGPRPSEACGIVAHRAGGDPGSFYACPGSPLPSPPCYANRSLPLSLADPDPLMTARFAAISFVASETPEAEAALEKLVARYGNADCDSADVIVALGGDGLMLQTLHRFIGTGKPIYGMNRGSVGFLMNEFRERGLTTRLEAAHRSIVHQLSM